MTQAAAVIAATAHNSLPLVGLTNQARKAVVAVDEVLNDLQKIYIPFIIPATELSAGTTIELVSPVAGSISKLHTVVNTAIVTGGAVTVKVGTTDVVGLSVTVADAATKGTTQSDTPTGGGTEVVAVGSRIQIVPAAAFTGGGALNGILEITF